MVGLAVGVPTVGLPVVGLSVIVAVGAKVAGLMVGGAVVGPVVVVCASTLVARLQSSPGDGDGENLDSCWWCGAAERGADRFDGMRCVASD